MPKRVGSMFDDKLTFTKLLQAHKRARKGKRFKREVIKFEIDLENNILNIGRELKKGIYKIGEYKQFKVFEPKERLIKTLPYKDRVVHQWYIEEFIKPYLVPVLIKDTYACIEGKGTYKAVKQVGQYMREAGKN
ncbi:MAG TPA: hypothetical protein DEP72_07310 [Clostridiales bacterium]|nr:hypothetical protein [Clostridiales bacterium]